MLWWLINKLKLPKPSLNGHDGFKHIYTDAQGNKWYAINNPANLHAMRGLTAWAYSKDAEFGLTREKLLIACEKINDGVNKKDIASIAKVVGVIEAALTLYAEPEIMLNLATCYTFLNDEKNTGFLDHVQQKKRELWQQDPVCKAFFLQWSVQFIQRFSASQNTSVLDYLEQSKATVEQIDLLLRKK